MPIEGSKAQIGRNLELDLGAYLQGKSFTRSVSISESTAVDNDCTSAPDGCAVANPYSSGRFASGGGAASHSSPSPLSSATTTISPDSPLPSSSSSPFSAVPVQPFDRVIQNPLPQDTMAASPQVSISLADSSSALPLDPLPCCSIAGINTNAITTSRSPNPYRPEFASLLQNSASHRTVGLLSHLIDSRLSSQWRDAMFSRSSTCKASLDPPSLPLLVTHNLSSDSAPDCTDSSVLRRPNPPTPSPTDDVAVVKRFKHSDVEPDSLTSQALTQPTKTQYDPLPHISPDPGGPHSVPPTFISLRLATCVCRLADHFESRYRDKLGNLLDDVARLSSSGTEGESSSEAAHGLVPPNSLTTPDDDGLVDECYQTILAARNRFHHVLSELFSERINWGRIIAMLAFLRALCEYVENEVDSVSQYTRTVSPTSSVSTETESECVAGSETPCASDSSPKPPKPSASPLTGPDDTPTSRRVIDVETCEPPHRQQSYSASGKDVIPCVDSWKKLRAAHYVAWTTEFIHGSHGIWDWISSNGGWDGLINFETERGIHDGGQRDDRFAVGITEDEALRLLRRAVTGVATLAVGAVGLVAALRFLTKRL